MRPGWSTLRAEYLLTGALFYFLGTVLLVWACREKKPPVFTSANGDLAVVTVAAARGLADLHRRFVRRLSNEFKDQGEESMFGQHRQVGVWSEVGKLASGDKRSAGAGPRPAHARIG